MDFKFYLKLTLALFGIVFILEGMIIPYNLCGTFNCGLANNCQCPGQPPHYNLVIIGVSFVFLALALNYIGKIKTNLTIKELYKSGILIFIILIAITITYTLYMKYYSKYYICPSWPNPSQQIINGYSNLLRYYNWLPFWANVLLFNAPCVGEFTFLLMEIMIFIKLVLAYLHK